MTEDEYGIEEGFGQETDDWMMEGETSDFISFKDAPGSILVYFMGKPVKGRSKYHKDQFWFPVEEVVDMKEGIVAKRTLSTSSNQLRKKLTGILKDHPTLFGGKIPVNITWTGNGMDRKYSVGVPAYESRAVLLEKVRPGCSPE